MFRSVTENLLHCFGYKTFIFVLLKCSRCVYMYECNPKENNTALFDPLNHLSCEVPLVLIPASLLSQQVGSIVRVVQKECQWISLFCVSIFFSFSSFLSFVVV